MTPAAWFSVANPFALVGWLVLLAAVFSPSAWRERLLFVAGRVWPVLLGLAYASALLAAWGSAPGGGFATLDQVATLFRSPGNLLAGWIHYLAFDLFVGAWVVADAQARGLHGAARLALLPCLALIFMFGPVGLLMYFALRPFLGREETRRVR